MNRRTLETTVRVGIAVVLWGVLTPVTRSADAGPPTLEKIGRSLGQVDTLTSRFVQERHLSLFDEPLRTEGWLCFAAPNRIRWEITAPYRSILVSDGDRVAQFEWTDGRWRRLDLGLEHAVKQVVEQIAGVMNGGYARAGGPYETSVSKGKDAVTVTLKPRDKRMKKALAAVEVHLTSDLKSTRRVVLREPGGDHTDIFFKDQNVGRKLPAKTFDRTRPADVSGLFPGAAKSGAD